MCDTGERAVLTSCVLIAAGVESFVPAWRRDEDGSVVCSDTGNGPSEQLQRRIGFCG